MKSIPSPSAFKGARASCLFRRAAAALALLGAGTATAQALISPVVVEFGPNRKIATVRVTLSDRAIKPMRLQVQLLKWQQDLRGAAVTEPSQDLIVTPRIAELRPGEQQVLRLALRPPLPAETESAYRLVLEDIGEPGAMELAGGAAVSFRMAYDLPVMVAPRGRLVSALSWRACPPQATPPAGRGVCLRVTNTGNRRLKLQSASLSGDGWKHSIDFEEPDAVLAGASRQWVLPVAAPGPLRGVQVHTVSGETVRADPAGQ